MSEYKPQEIEKKWQKIWKEQHTFKTGTDKSKPKYYVLDMFPYPSGAGLHVGHPLGYIATDIVSRYKRLKGYNVLHPMGYDSFGLPAEQYAVQTGQHPAITTEKNIARYREQLDNIGFSYDWSREIRTSDANYYKWTQWIFIKLFNHWYNKATDKAEPIETLIVIFEREGSLTQIHSEVEGFKKFTAEEWRSFSETEKYKITLHYRMAYQADTFVNWCPALGTVLANEEVKDGFSERGGHPVIRKVMSQWLLRITAYANRLINDLDGLDWPEPIKDQQKYWIGKSKGCMLRFEIAPKSPKGSVDNSLNGGKLSISVFTTRVDTIYGVTYLTLAPEHDLVEQITTAEQKTKVETYITYAKNKSERDRQADVKTVTGEFTGAYAINPLNNVLIPIWIGEYVLVGYGTGAVMAVPSSDTRDYAFANHFNLPIIQVQEGAKTDITKDDFDPKAGTMVNSDFLDGMKVKQAVEAMTTKVEQLGVGYGKINFKIRDAIFSRQRYWGEPIPVYYKDGLPYVLDESQLPLELPKIDEYKPTKSGEPPLARAEGWTVSFPPPAGEGSNEEVIKNTNLVLQQIKSCLDSKALSFGEGLGEALGSGEGFTGNRYSLETNTMPGWAGSSWYFLRYMDPTNDTEFASKEALDYWQDVDLYLGGSEHATGHLLYSRFWHKFLYDLGLVKTKEYAKKLINQGMIQGRSNFVYRIVKSVFISLGWYQKLLKCETEQDFLIIADEFNNQLERKVFVSDQESSGSVYNISFLKSVRNNLGMYVDVNIVENDILDIEKFKSILNEDVEFILEDGKYLCGFEVEKMSKSKLNVVNPDDVVEKYGADTLRLYEMFLGPLEMSKPWNTNSISGVSRFLRNIWKLFMDENGKWLVVDEVPNEKELKILHKTIKKVEEDIERFSFNTSVSTFMVCVNELLELRCHKVAILKNFLIILAPYAPHIAEELWEKMGNQGGISYATFPQWNDKYLIESTFEYPVSVNGKVRHKMKFATNEDVQTIENEVVNSPEIIKWLEGKAPKKIIVVSGKIVNVVV